MIGLIVFCFTLGSIRRTTCPSRWIKPRIGGFSFSSVPRLLSGVGAARPDLFLNGRRVALVTGDNVDFVGLDRAVQRRLGDLGNQTSAKMRRHVVIVVQAQLLSDLLVRQVQAHEIKTQDPGPKRLMVSGQNSTGQVIEPCSAVLAPVPLPMGFVMADHGGTATARAA